MKYLKYTPYAYLVLAIFFVFDALRQFNTNQKLPWLQVGIAALFVFMFFFRRNFVKKIEERNKQK